MSVLVQNLGDFLKLLVQAFNLSSTFPALIFVILVQLYIRPLLPEASPLRIDEIWNTSARVGATVISVALIAYLLDAANLLIIRLFEGYWFLDQFPLNWLRKINQDYVCLTQDIIRELEQLADKLMKQAEREQREDLVDLAEEVIERKREFIQEIAYKYPEEPNYVLPTPFGNVIAAAERYPKKTFGMDAVVLWPFLVPTLTQKNYAQFVVREKAVMDFLVNLTVVLAVFGCLLGIVEWYFNGWSVILAGKLSLVALSCLVAYVLSVQGAASWGATVRSAFVIFREELRQTLCLRRARYYADERQLWEIASNFFRAQDSLDNQMKWGKAIFDASSYKFPGMNKEETYVKGK